MENKTIVKNKKRLPDYHSCLHHDVILSGIIKTDIVVKFISSSRNDTYYIIKFDNGEKELIFSADVTYAAMSNMYKKVIKNIEEILYYCGIEISKENSNTISDLICECISRCESRYGMPVKDRDDYGADAILTIMGEDNGKPKHKVILMDELWDEIDLEEDFPLPNIFKGRYKIENKKITWLIEKENNTLEEIIDFLISEFDNPYLIITPTKDIILNFRMQTDIYEENNDM